MTPSEPSTCERCQQPATCHLVVVKNNKRERRHLCDACFRATAGPGMEDLLAEMQTACCQFCGGGPCSTLTDLSDFTSGNLRTSYICLPCHVEYAAFIQSKLEAVSTKLTPEEQLTAIRKVQEETGQHLRKWLETNGEKWS